MLLACLCHCALNKQWWMLLLGAHPRRYSLHHSLNRSPPVAAVENLDLPLGLTKRCALIPRLRLLLRSRCVNPIFGITMREVPQRLASPSEETPKKKKKKKNQISVSITLSNSILNCSTLALFTASAGSLFHIGAILYVKKFPH